MNGELRNLAADLIGKLAKAKLTLATAESCTGGGLGAALTAVPGASAVYRGGVIAYANEIKRGLLKVPETVLAERGAVSEECCKAMLEGAMRALGADAAMATTGIAGPGGGTPEKPVGTVVIGARLQAAETVRTFHFSGDREAVREQSMENALRLLMELLNRTALPKIPMEKFLMDREKDRIGNLSVDTRRVTTENAPVRDFREAQKEPARLWAGPSNHREPYK